MLGDGQVAADRNGGEALADAGSDVEGVFAVGGAPGAVHKEEVVALEDAGLKAAGIRIADDCVVVDVVEGVVDGVVDDSVAVAVAVCQVVRHCAGLCGNPVGMSVAVGVHEIWHVETILERLGDLGLRVVIIECCKCLEIRKMCKILDSLAAIVEAIVESQVRVFCLCAHDCRVLDALSFGAHAGEVAKFVQECVFEPLSDDHSSTCCSRIDVIPPAACPSGLGHVIHIDAVIAVAVG